MIRRTNVGSKVILQTEMENENVEPKFRKMYIRYNAKKFGLLGGCRPFVGLDGCHLKGRFDDIGRLEDLNLVFISEKQKGLLPTMMTLFPSIEHWYCVKHIYNNFKVNHKGMELKSVLWRCAGTTSVKEFERGLEYHKILDEEAWKYLADIEPAQWTRSYFSPRALTGCLRQANIINVGVDRVRLMSRVYIKNIGIEKYSGKLCPSIQDKLEKLKLESKNFCAMPSERVVYEVDNKRERHVVDLVWRTCSCRIWELTGIPYKHRVVAIFVNNEKPEDYTHPYCYKDAHEKTYKTLIPPMPS
ncbi:uncharacterized protein LOC142639750 [Castanea sativa]|uniref:uncharacterized protein LOC142639750 n=1 Tax=Castanea sativa TaxID=21020 RepID=UPI003F64F04C